MAIRIVISMPVKFNKQTKKNVLMFMYKPIKSNTIIWVKWRKMPSLRIMCIYC